MPECTHTVTRSLRAFMEGIVDYAGMFPPAKLPLPEAFENFVRYVCEAEAWMLGRFVVPAARLDELIEPTRQFDGPAALRFSVLGSGGDDVSSFLKRHEADLEAIARFEEAAGMMEVRLPEKALNGADLRDLLQGLMASSEREKPIDLFVELPIDGHFRRRLLALLQEIAGQRQLGVKLRTGGLDPQAFPAAGDLVFALMACRDARVRFKATAGLHHPIRRYDRSVRTHMHGFVNLFGAAILGAEHDLDEETLERILLDEHPANFRFDDDGFRWHDLTVPSDSVRKARHEYAVSFGSCSFTEPRDEILDLN